MRQSKILTTGVELKIIKSPFVWILIFSLAVLSAAFGLYFLHFHGPFSSSQTDWASFGSYIGGTLGAVFAFLSFLGLLYTIHIQRRELDVAIDALQKSASAQELQAEITEVQKFENTFYSLLEQHNSVLNNLKKKHPDFTKYFNEIIKNTRQHEFSKWALAHYQKEILKDYEVSPYFRILYQLLKYVSKNNVNNIKREFSLQYLSDRTSINSRYDSEKMYASIVRSFVPVDLLPMLAINCIPTADEVNNLGLYWAVLERYSFLEHTRFDKLTDRTILFLIFNNYEFALGENNTLDSKLKHVCFAYKDNSGLAMDIKQNSYMFRSLQENA
ncbi:TPA: hypothetical protein RZA60_003314 [Vibrio vulnificus]|nr:hypothetical protein [Vibrio vulnificus]HDY7624950.1 hypothetical protein [Vibrio vulnificus]HEB2782945.1 hypothetical protein [Vibrio vulnificus]